MSLYPSTSRLISSAETGLPWAIRNEINESWRISFSVSFATMSRIVRGEGHGHPAQPLTAAEQAAQAALGAK